MHLNPTIAALLEGLNNPSLPSIDLSLERMRKLLTALGNPEKKLAPVIHIAGTNGKGSTLAFLRAIYEASGYRVHAYTSPHLVAFNERIVIGASTISDDYLLALLQRVRVAAQTIPVTFFEATTAIAFLAFAEHAADVVLLETGLGGRLDATNVVTKPIATVITPIDYDHMEFLGDSLAKIATEKAGIMKHGVPCFVGAQSPEVREVLKRAARNHEAPLYIHNYDWYYETKGSHIGVECASMAWQLPLPALAGAHQHHNAALASVVAQSLPQLPVTNAALAKSMQSTRWPARLQTLEQGPLVDAWGARGPVMLDGGHNPNAALALRTWLEQYPMPTTMLCGMMKRKDASGFLRPLVQKISHFIAVPIEGNDSYTAEELGQVALACGIKTVSIANTFTEATTQFDDAKGRLLVAGSLFLAGEVLKNHS